MLSSSALGTAADYHPHRQSNCLRVARKVLGAYMCCTRGDACQG